jgi:hypothetical protein
VRGAGEHDGRLIQPEIDFHAHLNWYRHAVHASWFESPDANRFNRFMIQNQSKRAANADVVRAPRSPRARPFPGIWPCGPLSPQISRRPVTPLCPTLPALARRYHSTLYLTYVITQEHWHESVNASRRKLRRASSLARVPSRRTLTATSRSRCSSRARYTSPRAAGADLLQ